MLLVRAVSTLLQEEGTEFLAAPIEAAGMGKLQEG